MFLPAVAVAVGRALVDLRHADHPSDPHGRCGNGKGRVSGGAAGAPGGGRAPQKAAVCASVSGTSGELAGLGAQ